MGIYDNENSVQKSFDIEALPEDLLQSQWAEFIELKKVITEIFDRFKRPVSILDIGVGDCRVPKHLCGIKEIWEKIGAYHGIDNAAACLNISNSFISKLNISDKVQVSLLEADDIKLLHKKFDIIICTWFTPGNFNPESFSFENYDPANDRLDLSENERFSKIFRDAYDLLNEGGEIILGACYINKNETRLKQENFYRLLGMNVITDAQDSFTATKENFWSQRFTRDKIIRYCSFARAENISFQPLDTYEFAMQVRIKK
jgi:hypothetical protein